MTHVPADWRSFRVRFAGAALTAVLLLTHDVTFAARLPLLAKPACLAGGHSQGQVAGALQGAPPARFGTALAAAATTDITAAEEKAGAQSDGATEVPAAPEQPPGQPNSSSTERLPAGSAVSFPVDI